MADLSKLELTDATIVTLKDNSQANSDHRHYEKDIVPLVHKVYESNSYYATASNWDKSSWYFASIKPDSWYLPWKVRFKIHSHCPSYPANESITYAMVTGRSDSMSYANWNELQTTAHYYTVWYPLKKAGFDAGYGHAFGVSIYSANNYTSSSYYRTFEIDFIECENCTVTILDNPVLWENWTGTGSTYYGSRVSGNASSRGLQETGDTDTTLHNRIGYFSNWTGEVGIWAGSLSMLNARMEVENICTAADGTATTSNRTTATTKKANTHGFKVGSPLWYSNTGYNASTQITGSGVIYSSYGLIDVRYCFNIDLSNLILSNYGPISNGEPIYLVGYIQDDGLFYLRQDKWWTWRANPSDYGEDAIYVLVGYVYDCTSSNNRFTLLEENIWYKYSSDAGILVEYPFFNEEDAKKRFINTFTDKLIRVDTAYAKPLEELKIDLPYNSEGITSVTITHCGENLYNSATRTNGYNVDINTGALVENRNFAVSDYIFIPKGCGLSENVSYGCFFDLNKQFIKKADEAITFNYFYPPNEDCYIRLTVGSVSDGVIQKGLVGNQKRNVHATYQSEEKTIDLSLYSLYGGYIDITPNSAKLYSSYNADGTRKATADEYDLSNVTTFTTYVGPNHFFSDIHSELTITAILDSVPYANNADNSQTVNSHTVNADVPSTAVFTDEKVTQSNTYTPSGEYNGDLCVLLSNSPNQYGETAKTYKNKNLRYNPTDQIFKITNNQDTEVLCVYGDGCFIESTADITIYECTLSVRGIDGDDVEIFNGNIDTVSLNGVEVGDSPAFTDEKVAQTATSDNKRYEVLFSGTDDNTTRTEGTRKSSDLLFNPSKKELSLGNYAVSIKKETNTSDLPCGKISVFNTVSDPPLVIGVETIQLDGKSGNIFATSLNGATIGNNPAFTDTTYSLTQDAADGHILTLTPSSGTAQSVTVPDNMVTQTLTSTDANYPILFAKTTTSTTTVDNTNTARRNNSMYVNPSTGNLQITKLNGATVGDNPAFTDAKVTQNPLGTATKPLMLANSTSDSATTGQAYKQTNFTVNGNTNTLKLDYIYDSTTQTYTPAALIVNGSITLNAVNNTAAIYAPDATITASEVTTTTINGVTVGNSPEFTDTQSDWNASSGKAQILNKPTLGTASAKDVPTSGNASTTQVVMGDDTRLTDTRTPKSHTHGNIANGGTISSTAVTPASTDYILLSDTSNSGKIERGIAIGTDTTKYLRNDGTWEVPSGGSGGSVGQIYYCETDSTSTTTAFVVNVTGVAALTDGLIICVKNITGASASGCTLNLNGLGAKGIWLSEANAACTTEWKNNSAFLFVYDATNERWVMQTGRDTDVTGNNIIARYSKVVSGGNNVKKYSLFAMLPDGTYSSFTTNSGTSAKTFDSTNRFDIRKIYAYGGSSDRSTGDKLSASGWKMQGYDIDMRYSFNGVTTKDNTSSLTAEQPVYLVFDPATENSGCYKLKSPYYTQTPNATGAIYVLVGVMRDCYRLDFWFYNPAFTYDGTKLVPFSNATFAGLTDTYISNPAPCDVLMFDGSDWVNTNNIVLKDTNLHTTVSLDGDTGKITCAEMSVAEPVYTITKTSGAWNIFTDNPITALRTGNVVHLQINLEGSGSSVSAGNDGFTGTLGGGSLPALPVKFIDYYGNNVLIMYIQPNGQVKVRLIGSNLTVPSDNILNFSGTFIVN